MGCSTRSACAQGSAVRGGDAARHADRSGPGEWPRRYKEQQVERSLDELDREGETRALSHLVNKRVVTIGGGTGPFAVLSSLKRYPCSISAIVTMADSGGSSPRLMDEFGQLPLGDLRQALVALSRKGALWRDVFPFRFRQGHGQRPFNPPPGDPPDSHAPQVAEQAGGSGP